MKFKTLGLYYGKPRGFGINEKGEETGFCTEIYSSSEVYLISYWSRKKELKLANHITLKFKVSLH